MNYSKNIPDWQQYNALQSGASDGAAANMAVASVGQNVNPNHSFVPSISPPSMGNMNPDCLNKSQNDTNFGSRNYPTPPNGPNVCNMGQSSMNPMVHMSNCMGHYGNSSNMNPMIEDINNDMEHHRNPMPDEMTHRNNTMPVNHMIGPNMNVNNNMASGPRIPPNNSMPSNRQTPFIPGPCKGPCCVPDPNVGYGYGSYSPGAPYRENMHMPNYNPDDRRYRNNVNYRKDIYSNKSSNSSNQYHERRNYPDYKYRKEANMSRNYHQSSVILPNYGMQNYNVSGDYMKYHHYPSRGVPPVSNPPNNQSGMIKFQDPSKHSQYQNNNMMQNFIPNNNVPTSSLQNPYFNQPQNGPREYPAENRDIVDPNNTRLQPPSGPYAKQQMYRQKFAIQRFTLENQLKEMSRVPGYLSNPKYQECVLRYRDLLKLQRTVEFQSCMQESSMNTNANIAPPISPINLQFDHNGILINSNYLPTNYSGMCNQSVNPNPNAITTVEKAPNVPDVLQHQSIQLLDQNCTSGQHKSPVVNQDPNVRPSPDQQQHDFQVPQEVQQNKTTKNFADKPDLDVRQFLATWDESEEEENAVTNTIAKDVAPVTVVEFTDLNLVTNIAEAQKEFGILQSNPAIPGNGTVEINKVVSVVGCISNDSNEVPTIHIVDNLENKIVVEKINNAFNGINNANIKSVRQLVNKENSTNNESEKQILEQTQKKPVTKTDQSSNQISANQNLVTKSSTKSSAKISTNVKENITNVELNNPDDFSLPELSTYECTPISTSLNTPTHSDNEESLEQVANLRMSTNPIEIVKNSPIISFTQPVDEGNKSKLKSPHDSLNFDLVNTNEVIENFLTTSKTNISNGSNTKENKGGGNQTTQKSDNTLECEDDRQELLPQEWFSPAPVQYENDKDTNKNEEIPSALSLPTIVTDDSDVINNSKLPIAKIENKRPKKVIDNPTCDKIIQQFYADSSSSNNTSNIPTTSREKSDEIKMPTSSKEDNCVTKITKNPAPNVNTNISSSIEGKVDEDDIWREIANMDKNVDNNSTADLKYSSKEEQSFTYKLKQLLKHSKESKNIDLKKIKHLLKHDLQKLETNEHLNSHSKNSVRINEDSSNSSQSSDNNIKLKDYKRRGSKDDVESSKSHNDKYRRCCDSPQKTSVDSRWRSKSLEPNVNKDHELDLLQEFKKLKRKRSIDNGVCKDQQKILFNDKTNREKQRSENNQLSTTACHLQSSENNEELENKLMKDDSNKANKEFEIQLTNVNFRINDKDLHKGILALKDESKTAKESVDGIKIEINLSCSENKKSSITKIINCEDKCEEIKTADKKTTLNNENISTNKRSEISEQSPTSKSNNGNIKNTQTICSQNVNLPQIIRNDIICVRNELQLPNYSECLTPMIKDNLNKTFSNDHLNLKKSITKIDVQDTKDKLTSSNRPLSFKFTDDLYKPKLFDYSKDSMHIYNVQNLKNAKLLSSLNIDKLSTNPRMNIDFSNPCSSTKQSFLDKTLNYNFDKPDSSSYVINPLTFKNYASEDPFQDHTEEKNHESLGGFFNPAFMDDIDKMNTVPVYTTKDGKIKYSPNRKYTYKILLMETKKFHDTSSIYTHRYYQKSRNKKKHKSKRTEGKLHKSSKDHSHKYSHHKHESLVSNATQSNKTEQIRDCSVIAIAPSNSFVEPKSLTETSTVGDNKNNSIENQKNKKDDQNFTDKNISDVKNNFYQESPTPQEEAQNVYNENRSTVIKQLGIISQNHKDLEVDNKVNVLTVSKESVMNNVKCSTVIHMDNSNVKENNSTCNLSSPEENNDSGSSILKHLKHVVPPLSSELHHNLIRNNDFSKNKYQESVVMLKENQSKKPTRRFSMSTAECSENNAVKPRRKSFESDIIITSIFHDSEHHLRETVLSETTVDNVLEDVFKSPESITLNPDALNTSMTITEVVPTDIEENKSKLLDTVEELKTDDHFITSIPNDINIPMDNMSVEIVEHNDATNISMISENVEKTKISTEKTHLENISEPNTQIYMEYENVIIKEEDIEQNLSLEKDEKIPVIDREDDIPPLEKSNLDNNCNTDQSDNDSIECPTLESQVEPSCDHVENTSIYLAHKNENIWFENKFATEEDNSIKSPLVISNVLIEDIKDEPEYHNSSQCFPEKEKLIPKLVIRKNESSSEVFSRSKSPYKNVNKKNEYRSRPPKIPKMIIRNARSRPETPTIEEISVLRSSTESRNSKSRSSRSDDRSKKDYSDFDTKVPKMKINLESELPKVVIENIDIHTIQKTVPKMRIKKVRSLVPVLSDEKVSISSSHRSGSSDDKRNDSESRKNSRDRIPKLKIQKESCSKTSGKRSNSSSSQRSSKRSRKHSKDSEKSLNLSEYECNTNDLQSISDKVPKVIIKRTSTRSEFKCELSKSKRPAVEWQPRVTLNRSWILDTMARELKHMKVALKLTTPRNIDRLYAHSNIDPNKLKWDKFLSDLKTQKISNSNSEVISFDITASTFRKRKNIMSITREYTDSEESNFDLSSRIFDENMNSRDNEDDVERPKKKIRSMSVTNEKEEYVDDDACFDNILPRKVEERDNRSLTLCPIINGVEDDDSCTKMSTLSINRKLDFEGTHENLAMSEIQCKSYENGLHRLEENETIYDDVEDNFVIKVESSDESQTTIEILQASPDISQDGIEVLSGKDGKIYFDEVVPTRIGLELQIRNAESGDATKPQIKVCDDNTNDNAMDNSIAKETKKSLRKHSSSKFGYYQSKTNCLELSSYRRIGNESKRQKQCLKSSSGSLSYSDLLAKEVLAAKETLKRCFMKYRSENNSMCNIKPKTTEEKKKFSFNNSNLEHSRDQMSLNYGDNKRPKNVSREELSKRDRNDSRRSKSRSRSSRKSRSRSRSNLEPQVVNTTISLKRVKSALKETEKVELNNAEVTRKLASSESTNQKFINSIQKAMQIMGEVHEMESDNNSKDGKDKKMEKSREKKEDNMPILESQIDVEFASNPDRETSRSPPVITTPELIDVNPGSPKLELLKSDLYQGENNVKNVEDKQESEMTIAEIVRELAFHEKATIKHKRYCTLCERWFPSVIKHERHLSGYQHQHTELVQRRTIHTLYTLFTGKPCPKLLPANVTKIDYTPGEPTPLQIVVQDIVVDCDDMRSDKKKHEKAKDVISISYTLHDSPAKRPRNFSWYK